MAQQITVTGTVTDNLREPLPGVNVLVKGTTIGVASGNDGTYSIMVPNRNSVLVFQFLGYAKLEVPVEGKTVINVTLTEQATALDEVVVTALGIRTEKKALGYATAEVGTDEITAIKSTGFTAALSGKIPGMTIQSTSSQSGSGTRVVLREVHQSVITITSLFMS
ncbi:MAG: carboxypeptidase-like regulatory domain-containing protein [Bacteroidales bacterium]